MKWTELLRKDNYALLQSESDTQYAVASGYDPTQPEDQQWSSGTYFTYWNDAKRKADCWQNIHVARQRMKFLKLLQRNLEK